MPSRSASTDSSTISVVVVNWNAHAMLSDCLASLEPQLAAGDEVIVVDNGSTDGSIEVVERAHPAVRLVSLEGNAGFAEGCNRGIECATGDWILTLNNDAVLGPDTLRRLRAAAEAAGEDVGMLQPRILFMDRPERTNSTGIQASRDGSAGDRDFDTPTPVDDVAAEIFCPTAAAALYRRTMLDAIRLESGFLDAAYFMYFEDVDLGWRARLAGWRAFYVPGTTVLHAFQATSQRHGPRFVEAQCNVNRMRTLLKNASWRLVIETLPITWKQCRWVSRQPAHPGREHVLRAAWGALTQRRRVRALKTVGAREIERRWMLEY